MLLATAVVVTALFVHNLLINRLPDRAYVPACWATASAVLAVAWVAGLDANDLGLSASWRSLGAGLATAMVVTAVIVAAARAPVTRPVFADRRMDGTGPAGVAYQALVRIPLGTVALEETAFRGVLVSLLAPAFSLGWAVVAASALFGMWHIVPTALTLDVNGVATTRRARAGALAGAVAVTAVAGALFCWLRVATGSLLAPAILHAAATSFSSVAAYRVTRRARAAPRAPAGEPGRAGSSRRSRRPGPPAAPSRRQPGA